MQAHILYLSRIEIPTLVGNLELKTLSRGRKLGMEILSQWLGSLFLIKVPTYPVVAPWLQVAGCRCTLLAVNSSISLAGSEEQIHFSQQSAKMLKMASESSIHALLLLLGLFVKISYWVPLLTMTSKIIENALLVLIYYVHAQLK